MDSLQTWWSALEPMTQWFYIAAAFFSVFFVWQLVMALVGIGGEDTDIDTHVDVDTHVSPDDVHDTVAAFKLLSFRSILAFFTLFSWAGALYSERQVPAGRTMAYASVWGVAAMALVSLLLYSMRKMTATGNMRIESTIGGGGTVYLDIPAGGEGEVRMLCNGVLTHFKARVADGTPLKAGAAIRVTGVLGANALEVEEQKQPIA